MKRLYHNNLPSRLLTTVGAVVTVIVCLVTLLSAYGGMIDPRTMAIASIAAMGFPIMWVVTVVTTLVDLLFISKRLAIVPALTLLISIGPWLTFSPVNFDRSGSVTDSDTTLTVMTWNIFYFDTFDSTLHVNGPNPSMDYILNSGADIVCLQEIHHLSLSDPKRNITAAQLEQLDKVYPYRIDLINQAQSFYSKYPIREEKTIHFDDESAMFSTAVASIGPREVYVINLHLQSFYLNSDDRDIYKDLTKADVDRSEVKEIRNQLLPKLETAFREHAIQADHIAEYIDSLPKGSDIILMGDFNDVPGSYAARRILKAGLHDAYADGALGPTITYSANRFYFRIDQIFYGGDMEPLKVWRGDIRYSDHYPLLAKFLLK